MEFLDKLRSLLEDPYIRGVQSGTDKTVLFVDPKKFDRWSMERAKEEFEKASEQYEQDRIAARKIPDEAERHRVTNEVAQRHNEAKAKFDGIYANEVAKQLDAQYQGISTYFEPHVLAAEAKKLRDEGMHIKKYDALGEGVYVTSHGQSSDGKILEFFSSSTGIKSEHYKDIPGDNRLWREAIGRHENGHIGQPLVEKPRFVTPEERPLLVLQGENGGDLAMREFLLSKGRPDMVEAWIDYRAMSAGRVEPEDPKTAYDWQHATGILLAKPDNQSATPKHVEAAQQFPYKMHYAVSQQLGITYDEAVALRTEDPQKFATATEDALKAGKLSLPTFKMVSDGERLEIIAKELGVTQEEASVIDKNLDGVAPDKREKFLKAVDDLEDRGAFIVKEEANPHIAEYAEQYVAAVRRRVVPDTKPEIDISATAKKSAAAPEIVTETPVPQAASADAAPAAPSPATPPAPADAEPSPESIEAPVTAASSSAPVSDESDISAPPPAGEADAAKDSATPDHLVSDETTPAAPVKDYAQGMNGTAFTAKTDPTGPMEFSFSSNLLSQGIFTTAANAESFTLVDAKVEPISPAFSQASNDASFSAAKFA